MPKLGIDFFSKNNITKGGISIKYESGLGGDFWKKNVFTAMTELGK